MNPFENMSHVAIIGAGTIGGDTAHWLASELPTDVKITIVDISPDALLKCNVHIGALMGKLVRRGKITEAVSQARLARINATVEFAQIVDADWVIEATTEDLDRKRTVLQEVFDTVSPETLVCTTTSSLRWGDIFGGAPGLRRCFVMHPYTPVWRAKTIEVVGVLTGSEIHAFCALLTSLNKVPEVTADRAGFGGNVLFCGLMQLACILVERGAATTGEVDYVLSRSLSRTGPFGVHNYIGPHSNGITAHVLSRMADEIDPFYTPTDLLQQQMATCEKWVVESVAEMDETKELQLRRWLLGGLFAMAMELINNKVISVEGLNFLTLDALGYRLGIAELMRKHEPEIGQMVNAASRRFDQPWMWEAWATEGADHPLMTSPIDIRREVVHVQDSTLEVVTVFRPHVLNAVRSNTVRELLDIFVTERESLLQRGINAVILQGFGGHLAGADVTEIASCTTPEEFADFPRAGQALTLAIESMPIPVVGVIDGYCLGGGAELMLSCWLRVYGSHTVMGQPEVTLGIIPGMGATYRLPRQIGYTKGLELLRTGRKVSGTELQDLGWGILADDPFTTALAALTNADGRGGLRSPSVLEAVDTREPDTLPLGALQGGNALSDHVDTLLLGAVFEGFNATPQTWPEIERRYLGLLAEHPDCREGLQAFLQKRRPVWETLSTARVGGEEATRPSP